MLLFHALISEAHPPLYGIQRLGILPLIGTLLVRRATAYYLAFLSVKFSPDGAPLHRLELSLEISDF